MNKKIKSIVLALASLFLIPAYAQAHCPLCTVGAGALAVLAASLGVSTASVGVFIGAFSLALGLWVAKLVKKKYFKQQDALLTLAIFLSTIIPIMPLIKEYRPLYIKLFGSYGTLFHNTYAFNLYLTGAAVGAVILWLSPYLSKALTKARRGETLPYQGLGVTFVLIIIAAIVFQIIT
ncbi:MAG: hypothetical protein Q8O98_02795 [bacterium]|nr:hypothetical protein [bacterium]